MARFRFIGSVLGVGILALGALWISCGGGGGGSSSASSNQGTPPPNHVWVGNGGSMAFQPASLTVTAGTTVTWDFLSGTHNVTSGTAPTSDGAYASPTQTSGTFTHQYSTAGTYHYFCSIHGTMMTGTVTVN